MDIFSPTDFLEMDDSLGKIGHSSPDSPESLLVGGPVRDHPERLRAANPITRVSRDVPPLRVLHGDQDPLVPLNQSESLLEALKKRGGEVELVVMEGQGHGFQGPEAFQQCVELLRAKWKR